MQQDDNDQDRDAPQPRPKQTQPATRRPDHLHADAHNNATSTASTKDHYPVTQSRSTRRPPQHSQRARHHAQSTARKLSTFETSDTISSDQARHPNKMCFSSETVSAQELKTGAPHVSPAPHTQEHINLDMHVFALALLALRRNTWYIFV